MTWTLKRAAVALNLGLAAILIALITTWTGSRMPALPTAA